MCNHSIAWNLLTVVVYNFAMPADSDGLCCLCDKEINAKLNPCGHSVMCKDCTGEAKRCPTCHVGPHLSVAS